MLEQEIKFLVSDAFSMPPLTNLAPGIAPQPREELHYATTYWDTADQRLVRWGCTMRYRDGEGWTLKLPSTETVGLLSRPELTFEGDDDAPPAEALALVRAYVRRAILAPGLRLATVRRRTRLVTAAGSKAAEVVDDRVAVVEGGAERAFREVEIELGPAGDAALLDAATQRLRAAGAGEPDLTSKSVRALGHAIPEPEVAVPKVRRRATPEAIIQLSLAAAVRQVLAYDPLVRLGDDPEAVHLARVATRRLRADLRTFGPLLEPEWAGALRDDLRWLGSALGALRDGEVMRERLTALAKSLPDGDQSGLAPLLDHLEGETAARRAELRRVMDADRYLDLAERLIAAAREAAFLADDAKAGKSSLVVLVVKPWRQLGRAVSRLGDKPSDEALHRVRIHAKRCRYAAEAVAPVIGKPARRLAQRAAALQSVLGDHQDSVTAQAWLRQAAADGHAPFTAGELLILERGVQREARATWPTAWQALRRCDPRRW